LKELVSTHWLNQNLNHPKVVILDASLATNALGKEFEKFDKTIPKARFFDLKNVFNDKTSPFPNTVPKPELFKLECRKLGINRDSKIVVFDNNGIYSSPRVWWLFKVMGHDEISVLDGGLPSWIEDGYETREKEVETFTQGDFQVQYNAASVVGFEEVSRNIGDENFIIVDARSESRFNGTGKEPRKHLKSGNIENSVNLPYQEVLEQGKYKSKNELNQIFEKKCTTEKELVFSCGSGLTACIIMLACQIGHKDNLRVYDGSWTEWAERNNLKYNE